MSTYKKQWESSIKAVLRLLECGNKKNIEIRLHKPITEMINPSSDPTVEDDYGAQISQFSQGKYKLRLIVNGLNYGSDYTVIHYYDTDDCCDYYEAITGIGSFQKLFYSHTFYELVDLICMEEGLYKIINN